MDKIENAEQLRQWHNDKWGKPDGHVLTQEFHHHLFTLLSNLEKKVEAMSHYIEQQFLKGGKL